MARLPQPGTHHPTIETPHRQVLAAAEQHAIDAVAIDLDLADRRQMDDVGAVDASEGRTQLVAQVRQGLAQAMAARSAVHDDRVAVGFDPLDAVDLEQCDPAGRSRHDLNAATVWQWRQRRGLSDRAILASAIQISCPLQRGFEPRPVERFQQKVRRADGEGLRRVVCRVRVEDHRRPTRSWDRSQELEAAGGRQVDVDDDEIDRPRGDLLDHLVGRSGLRDDDDVGVAAEPPLQSAQRSRILLCQQRPQHSCLRRPSIGGQSRGLTDRRAFIALRCRRREPRNSHGLIEKARRKAVEK